jgi:hypothetical protein
MRAPNNDVVKLRSLGAPASLEIVGILSHIVRLYTGFTMGPSKKFRYRMRSN